MMRHRTATCASLLPCTSRKSLAIEKRTTSAGNSAATAVLARLFVEQSPPGRYASPQGQRHVPSGKTAERLHPRLTSLQRT